MRIRSVLKTAKKGFTLIELLVVVVLIVALMIVFRIGCTSAREDSFEARCLKNLKMIGQALHMYFDSWDDHVMFLFKSQRHYAGPLIEGSFIPEKTTAFICPNSGTGTESTTAFLTPASEIHKNWGEWWGKADKGHAEWGYGRVDYGMNWYLGTGYKQEGLGWRDPSPLRVSQMTNPRMVLLVESVRLNGMAEKRLGTFDAYPWARDEGQCAWTGHDKVANTLWLDGSAVGMAAERSSYDEWKDDTARTSASLYSRWVLAAHWHSPNPWTWNAASESVAEAPVPQSE